jgi:hypothetical protein
MAAVGTKSDPLIAGFQRRSITCVKARAAPEGGPYARKNSIFMACGSVGKRGRHCHRQPAQGRPFPRARNGRMYPRFRDESAAGLRPARTRARPELRGRQRQRQDWWRHRVRRDGTARNGAIARDVGSVGRMTTSVRRSRRDHRLGQCLCRSSGQRRHCSLWARSTARAPAQTHAAQFSAWRACATSAISSATGFEWTISLGKYCRAPRKRNGETRTSPDWWDVRGIFPAKISRAFSLRGLTSRHRRCPSPASSIHRGHARASRQKTDWTCEGSPGPES